MINMSEPLVKNSDEDESLIQAPSSQSLDSLPPEPIPNTNKMRCEFAGGTIFVLGLTATLVSVVHVVNPNPAWLTLIYLAAACALTCLLGLAFADPGVVHRSHASCFPIPRDMVVALEVG